MKVIIQHKIGVTITISFVKTIESKDDYIIFKFDKSPDRFYWCGEWEIISVEDD